MLTKTTPLALVSLLILQTACSSIPETSERDLEGIKDQPTRAQSKVCGDTIGRARTRDGIYGSFTTVGTGIGLVGTIFTSLGVELGKDTVVPVVSLVSTSLSFVSQIARSIDTGDVRDIHQDTYLVGIKHAADAERIEAQNAEATKPITDARDALMDKLKAWEAERAQLAGATDEAGEKAARLKELDAQHAQASGEVKELEAQLREINKDAYALREQAASAFKKCEESIWF